MKFDASTLREEMEVIESQVERSLKEGRRDDKLIDRYIVYARKLRQKEFEDNGYVAARSSVTGY
jgi:hypothetical protein